MVFVFTDTRYRESAKRVKIVTNRRDIEKQQQQQRINKFTFFALH